MANVHDGHRERMRQEFLRGGLESFSDIRALELLLFFSRPQGDVNPLAHALIAAFGSLANVLDADPADLQRVPGVGKNTVVLLKLFPAMSAKYLASRAHKVEDASTLEGLWNIFSPHFFGARNELTFVGCFDNNLRLLGVRKLGEGGPDSSNINIRLLSQITLSLNASAAVLAHNHPSGSPDPSQADISTTHFLKNHLRTMEIELYDHVILTDDDIFSMRKSGYMKTLPSY